MKHGPNRNSFSAFLRLKAAVTNKTADGVFARNVLKKFAHRSYKLMRLENVSERMLDELDEIYTAFKASNKFVKVDKVCHTQWADMGDGCHVKKTHFGMELR